MKCLRNDDLTELCIKIAMGEVLDPESAKMKAHIKACSECERRFKAYLATIQGARQVILSRARHEETPECLNDNLLSEYLDQKLDPEACAQVEAHLATCHNCRRQFVDLAELIEETSSAPPEPFSYVIGIAPKGLRFLAHPGAGFSLSVPQYATVMGNDAEENAETQKSFNWSQSMEDVQLDFSAVHVDENHVNLVVRVSRKSTSPSGTRLTLWCEGKMIQSETLVRREGIQLNNLEISTYNGVVFFPDGKKVPFAVSLQALES